MQFDIYVGPADANESVYKSPKMKAHATGNLICTRKTTLVLVYRITRLLFFLFNAVEVIQKSNNNSNVYVYFKLKRCRERKREKKAQVR